MEDDVVQAAAIHRGDDDDVAGVFTAAAGMLAAEGITVRGLIQYHERDPDGRLRRHLRVLGSGESMPISQVLGQGSTACSLDTAALAEAAAWLRRFQQEAPGLVIVDRFGPLEAKGKGFASELLGLLAAGIPVLTSVRDDQATAWEAFTGGLAEWLPPEAAAVTAWGRGAAHRG
ncbi:DUF2478 domain-containing protein [Arhodomonas sp. SL1]|uniref:DUF2478 domain-containing protein n=1 Tax=Arhodomonas sp. SL1 TaxID=3425691 RepID=UPI003F884EC9